MNKEEIRVEENKIKRGVAYSWIAYVVLALAAIVIGIVGFWSIQPNNVLNIKNAPVPIRTIHLEAHPAGVVILKYDYCKNISVNGTIRTSFVGDASEIFLPLAEDKTDKMCADGLEVPYLVPPQIVTGTYHLHFKATYILNPLKTVVQEWDSQPFDVEK